MRTPRSSPPGSRRRPGRVRRLVQRLLGRSSPPPLPPVAPPDEDVALVPLRPRGPVGSGSVALEPPDEPDDVDARGRESA